MINLKIRLIIAAVFLLIIGSIFLIISNRNILSDIEESQRVVHEMELICSDLLESNIQIKEAITLHSEPIDAYESMFLDDLAHKEMRRLGLKDSHVLLSFRTALLNEQEDLNQFENLSEDNIISVELISVYHLKAVIKLDGEFVIQIYEINYDFGVITFKLIEGGDIG